MKRIDEKIAMLECLKDAIRTAEINMSCYSTINEKDQTITFPDEYSAMRYNAWNEIKKLLEKQV